MSTKLLLLLGVVLGVLLLATFIPGTEHSEPEVLSQLIESGHFVLEQNEIRVLEESYTLEYHPVDGYLLNSQGAIAANGATISLGHQTQYDHDFSPVYYQLAAGTPSGTQLISAQMGQYGLSMEVRVGLSSQTAKVVDVENLAVLDNNLISQFAVLLLAIRTEALDRNFTAAIPQALLSLPARIDGPNTVTFYSGDTEYEGKQFDLYLGDTVISLVEYAGRLVGLENRSQGTIGYDLDLLPSGFALVVQEEAVVPASFIEHEISFTSDDLTLVGTLTLPIGPNSQKMPAALLIHGSGPVDRDGNAAGMQMDAYRQLAHSLADIGIASFRFDKRGVGASEGNSALASRDDLVNDVRAALATLREQPQIDSFSVVLIGHSEGAYLAPILAAEDPTIAGVALLAGAARPLDEIIRWQVETLAQQQGLEGEALEAELMKQDQYTAFVKRSQGEWADYTVTELQAEIPWVTEDLAVQLKAAPLALSWLRQHFLTEPAETIALLDCPVLIISGEKDAQVPSSEAELLRQLLEMAGNNEVAVYVLPDLNHLLRYHPEEPNLIYRHLNEPVDPRVVEVIQDWIMERFGN